MKNRNLINMLNTGIISLALFASAFLSGCQGDDPISPPDPQKPPVEKNDTVFIKLRNVQDFRNNASVLQNADPKKTYWVDVENDIAADANDLEDPLGKYPALTDGKSNIKMNKNGRRTYPNTETGRILKYDTWNAGIKLGLTESQITGLKYLAASESDSLKFASVGHTLNVLRGEYGDAKVVQVNSEQELIQKVAEAKNLANAGEKVAFVVVGNHNLDNTKSNSLDDLLTNPNVEFFTENSIVGPSMDSVYVGNPEQFAKAFKSIKKSSAGDKNHFYVPGNNPGKIELAIKAGTLRSDTVHASSGNLERGILPRKFIIDTDLYKIQNIDVLSDYENAIYVEATDNPAAPGGKNRPHNWNPEWYSIPDSRAVGEDFRVLHFTYNPVIGTYWDGNTTYTDIALGKGHSHSSHEECDYGCGNFYINKLMESNRVAEEWAKARGKNAYPFLSVEIGQTPVYTINFKMDDISYIWNIRSSVFGDPANNYVLVSVETLQAILRDAFKLSFESSIGANYGFYVRVNKVNPVMKDTDYDYADNPPNGEQSATVMQRTIYPFGWFERHRGIVIPRRVAAEWNKKVY